MSVFIKNTNYHTYEGFEAELHSIVDKSAAPADIVTAGHSTEDRPIHAVCFGDGDFRKPELLYFALTHAMEFVGAEAALALVRTLADPNAPASLASALEKINVWVLPALNPDGYVKIEKQLSTGLGLAYARGNSRGVDLNRNFPVGFYHIPRSLFGGSPVKISPHYRGQGPCSEAEARVIRDFILGHNVKISLSFHSFGARLLFPYHHDKKRCRDHDTLMKLGEEMAAKQERPYRVSPGWNLYLANGEIDDWLYDECGILPFTMEIGRLGVSPGNPETWLNPFFWANPVDPRNELDNILPAALHLVDATQEMFVSGRTG